MYVFRTLLVFLAGILSPLLSHPLEERTKDVSTRIESYCAQQLTVYQRGIASWYGEQFHGKTMANGRPFNMFGFTVAHRTLPLGTPVCVVNPANGKSVGAVVTDRGPYIAPRIIDLSYNVATVLGLVNDGVGQVIISVRNQERDVQHHISPTECVPTHAHAHNKGVYCSHLPQAQSQSKEMPHV